MQKGIISRNIELLMEHFGIRNESQLAKQVGLRQSTINKLISGVTIDPRISTLAPIAEHFNLSVDTLVSNHPTFGEKTKENGRQTFDTLVPLITYHELSEVYDDIHSLNIANWPHWIPIPPQKKESDYYAVSLKDHLPKPFELASILVICNSSDLPNNNYCLLKHLDSNSISIKKILFDDGKQWLFALQSELSPSEFNSKLWQPIGVVHAFVANISNNVYAVPGESK